MSLEDQVLSISATLSSVIAGQNDILTALKNQTTPPPAQVDLSPVLAALAGLQTSLDSISAQFVATPPVPAPSPTPTPTV